MSAPPVTGHALAPWRHVVAQPQMDTWAAVLHDPNPIHLDADAVARVGRGTRTINQGPANIAYLFNLLGANFPKARVLSLDSRMTALVHCGDEVVASGEVTSVLSTADGVEVRCALALHVAGETAPAVLGTARVLLPV